MNTCNECVRLTDELAIAKQEIERLKAELEKVNRTSLLTGLKNKNALNEDIEDAIASETRDRHEKTCIFFIDMDNFKQLNDNYSHEFGDECIKAIANTLNESMRITDTVYHISGDEFVIKADLKLVGSVSTVKQKVQTLMEETTVSYEGKRVRLSGSIGHSVVEKDDTVRSVLERADKNLQLNKKERLDAGLRTARI